MAEPQRNMELESEPICKVLLVDDEENILRAISRTLIDEEGIELFSAESGARGVEILAEHPDVALILSDQRMPGMSGAEFLQQARELAPDAVRMVLTGYADIASTIDAINKGGAARYLTKPWDDEVLRNTVREGVAQYRMVQENRALHALVERQNRELEEWNRGLKGRVMEQTATIRRQNEELRERNRQVTASFRNSILAFSRLIELHSSRLQEHTRNVTELCLATARAMGLGEEETETLRNAALLHDIGVIGIAPEILDKRMTAMSREEMGIFLQHAVRGQTTLEAVEELREVGVVVRHHHEHFDGSGFPDRKRGAEIPLASRIIACADFVDRELETEWGKEAVEALFSRVVKELGTRLDPEVFEAMREEIRRLYAAGPSRRAEAVEKELRPRQLLPGMTVTRNVNTGSGLLLVGKGTRLDEDLIAMVQRHYSTDPPAGGIYVSWRPCQASGEGEVQPQQIRLVDAEREIGPLQLQVGMRITRNLYSGTGLLLLTEGTILEEGSIASVCRYFEIDPPSGGVFVTKG